MGEDDTEGYSLPLRKVSFFASVSFYNQSTSLLDSE